MIIKRRAKISFVGLDRIRVITHCQQKEFNIADFSRGLYLNLETLEKCKIADAHFMLTVNSGNGSLEDPYFLSVYRMNYDKGRVEMLPPIMRANGLRVHIYETSVWDTE